MRRFFLYFLIIFVLLSVGFSAWAYTNPGKPTGFVNDFAGLLTPDQKSALENKLTEFDKNSSNEISVVTIKSLGGDTIENYAVKLFADWGIGKAKKDNGVLLLVALDDRQMRIEVGYGLEGALPDATAYQIITKTLRPAFQAGNYYAGIDSAVDQMIAATKGEYQPEPSNQTSNIFKNISFDSWFWLIIVIFYLLSALRRRLAKTKSWWEGGIWGAVLGVIIALIFLRVLVYFIVLPLVLGVCGLIFDFLVSRILPPPGPRRPGGGFWFFGGPGSGSHGSGGGFGGFGGGGSGGGGSSGGW